MSTDRHGLFKPLEPPPGGAEQLRRRLDAAARERPFPLRPVAAGVTAVAAAALAAVAAVGILLDTERDADREPEDPAALYPAELYDAPQFDRLLGRPLGRAEPRVTVNDRTAEVAEIPTGNRQVRLYRLE